MRRTGRTARKGGDELYTLDELVRRLADALEASEFSSGDRRVARVPDARTIRYYHSLGLVDPPSAYQGARALYGRRHFLQVAAIKAFQAAYLPLAKVQERLLGLGEEELAEIAGPLLGEAAAAASPSPRRFLPRLSFWKAEPGEQADASWRPTHEIELQPGVWLRVARNAEVPENAQALTRLLNKAKAALVAYRDMKDGRPGAAQPDQGGGHE